MEAIGIDIGGTKSAVVLGRLKQENWKIVDKKRFPTVPNQPEYMIKQVISAIRQIISSHSLSVADIVGIGVSCGGPLNSKTGRILSPPNLPGWDDIPITDILSEQLHLPCHLQNDANACAVAEWKFGAGKGAQSMAFLTFGTGLGAGLILDGRLYTGPDDMAGELGHLRLTADGPIGYGKAGSVEGYCSGGGIAQLGQQRVREELANGNTPALLTRCKSIEAITAKDIGILADEGDLLSKEIYRLSGEKLGYALSVLVDLLNLEVVVIGSIYARSHHLMSDSMRAVMERECLSVPYRRCQIRPSGLGEQVGDIAALAVSLGV